MPKQIENLIVIGASAGGPRILKEIFTDMPVLNAGVVLIQHMPKFINESLRQSIAGGTRMKTKIAENQEFLENGTLYVAPSEKHLKLLHNRQIRLFDGDKVNYVCPSVDVVMLSVKPVPGMSSVGLVLTGMGRDGAEGIAHLKHIHGTTIAQDEASSVIFGMPKEAISTGCVDWILPPAEIRKKLIDLVGIARDHEP
jgi:two-component system, chemotaxis family, protein-glutamate methylesterase/glutaminase